MSLGMNVTLRNARLDKIRDAIDAGSGPGTVDIYTAPRPATGAAPTGATLLATLTFSDPSAPNASAGQASYNTINPDASADATGTATWARIKDSTGAHVFDCAVTQTGGGGEMQFGSVAFQAGQQVSLTSFVLTEGNV
jgi:hypothetical protein